MPTQPAFRLPEKLQSLIDEAYTLFAEYPARFPLNVCTCDCCMSEDEQRELLRFPLAEIPEGWVCAYLGCVPLDDVPAVVADMKHFLPRIAQGIVRREEVRILTEATLDKLHVDRTDLWQSEELDWLNRFAAAWLEHVLRHGEYDDEIKETLEMFARAGLPMPPLLDLWTRHAHSLPALRAFVELYLAAPYGYQLPDPDCDMKASREALLEWFAHPKTVARFHAALEQALLAGREDPCETLLWEQCYDWLDERKTHFQAA